SGRTIELNYKDLGFDKDDEIILYCKSSFRAAQTAVLLEEAGYSNVKVYDGAWLEWSSQGMPSEEKTPEVVPTFTGCASQPEVQETSMEVTSDAPDQTADESTAVDTDAAVEVSLEDTVKSYFANMPDHIYKINQAEFIGKVEAGEEMTILDIRSAEDYAKGHVQGAVNAPWGGTAISDILV
ncbi:hypothetical protein ADUPG1_001750, partial [Aduncisulcus paluster]